MGGSKSKSESSQTPVPLNWTERELQGVQLDFAENMLKEFLKQREFQWTNRAAGIEAAADLRSPGDPFQALQPSERAGLTREAYGQALAGSRRAGEISDLELAQLRAGVGPVGTLTPEQDAAIRASAESELASGLSDIDRYSDAQRERVASELAPRLGLHRSDTPILDRGNRIAAEAVNAASRLVSDVRGREAQARLQYPLAVSQARLPFEQLAAQRAQTQQSMGWNRADVLADLNQRAYQNRLALSGQAGQLGLGLATGYNVPGAQQSMHPVLASQSSSRSSGGGVLYGSSRKIKEILAAPNGPEILAALAKLPVAFWRYLVGTDEAEHVGPFAEDMRDAFGIGDGDTIDLRDLVGLLLIGIQELTDRLTALEASEA
jgi:hypothetical protein